MACHNVPPPHASRVPYHALTPRPLCPHVPAPDRLTCWLTPFRVSHMNSLSNFFPPHIIAMWRVLLSRYVAPSTLANYSSGLLRFSCFCDDYHIPEPYHMPASEALLTLFIMCHGAASVSASMMQHWLLGLELWHEINSTPWCGHSTLKCVVKVTCPLPYMLLMESDICTGCLSLSSYVLMETMGQCDNPTHRMSMHQPRL